MKRCLLAIAVLLGVSVTAGAAAGILSSVIAALAQRHG